MSTIQRRAALDAESDYRDHQRTEPGWRLVISRIRGGDHLVAAITALQAVGVERMCVSWGVDPAGWDAHSEDWLEEFALAYAARIEALLPERVGPPPGVPR